MSPRKKSTPRAGRDAAAAEYPAGEDAAAEIALEALQQAQRDAVYGPARSAPLVRDDTMPAPQLPDILARFQEAGHAWALTGHLDFGDLAPTFVDVEPREEGPPMFRVSLFAMAAVNGGYGRGLAERYLAECALVGDETRTASERLNTRVLWRSKVHALRAIREDAPPDMAERLTRTKGNVQDLSDYLTRFDAWRLECAFAEKHGTTVPPEPEPPAWLAPPKARALASVARELTKPQADGSVLLVANRSNIETRLRKEVPFVRAMLDELAALTEACERPATLEDVDAWTLTRADGTLAPTPEAWLESLTAREERHRADVSAWLSIGMEALASDARKGREAELQARNKELERRLAMLEEEKQRAQNNAGLALMPRSMHLGFQRTGAPEWIERRQKEKDGGELIIGGPDAAQWETRTNVRELAGLTVPHFRVLFGLCGLLAPITPETGGKDGAPLWPKHLTLTAAEFYEAAGVNVLHNKTKHEVFMAAVELSERKIQHELTLKGKKGEPSELLIVREEVLHFAPKFDYDEEIARKWQDWHRARAKMSEKDRAKCEWDGPLPSGYVFTLPQTMRHAGAPLVFSRDVFRRLETAAKEERGKLHPLDLAVFLEATITRQSQQYDAFSVDGAASPVYSFRAYIYPRQFLADYLPDQLKKDRKRAETQYVASLNVNQRAGTFISVQRNDRNKRTGALRDIVVPNPDLLPGLVSRAKGARLHGEAKAKHTQRKARKSATTGSRKAAGTPGKPVRPAREH